MPAVSKTKYVTMATWDDAPHLTKAMKEELWDSIPAYQRKARAKGIPQLGSGAIYPFDEDNIKVDDFRLPNFWPRAYALDVGWNCTAALWGAWDQQSDTIYIYSNYKKGKGVPAIHAQAIKARGKWIPGVIDPAARGRAQADGERLVENYLDLGLDLDLAKNAVYAGTEKVYSRLAEGRLKVFASLASFFEEYRLYRRDENGKIVKDFDHLMDCLRYLVMSGIGRAKSYVYATTTKESLMGGISTRNRHTGY